MKKMLFLLLLLASNVFAAVPNEINYQGRLRYNGVPANGDKMMNFKIYASATGEDLLWGSGLVQVHVSSGIFSYVMNPSLDWRNKDLWIETVVDSKVLSPREKITAQAFALHARTSEDISKSSGENIIFSIGNSTIATITSDSKLNVQGEVKSLSNGTTFYMVPRGAIIMWAGLISAIPSGWALCDGANGTPDLRDRFILSVSNSSENPGSTGGSNSYSLNVSQLPAHNHTGSTAGVADHSHSGVIIGVKGGGDWSSGGSGTVNSGSSGAAGGHSHSFTTNNTGSGNPIDNRPAYYKMAFIMKQ